MVKAKDLQLFAAPAEQDEAIGHVAPVGTVRHEPDEPLALVPSEAADVGQGPEPSVADGEAPFLERGRWQPGHRRVEHAVCDLQNVPDTRPHALVPRQLHDARPVEPLQLLANQQVDVDEPSEPTEGVPLNVRRKVEELMLR